MILVKEIQITPLATPIARVVCEEHVNLNEEDRLRQMLRQFYARTNPGFSSVVIQVLGTVILFRTVPNCKRSPNKDDVAVILRAMNLECAPVPKPARKKKRTRPKQAARQNIQAA